MAVLVDPRPEDWSTVARLDARVVLVLSGQLEEAAVVRAFLYGADTVVPASRVVQELVPVVALVGKAARWCTRRSCGR